jgi:hypothetical protein
MKFFLLLLSLIQFSYASNWEYVETYEGVKLYELKKSEQYATPFKAVGKVNAPLTDVVKALVDVDSKNKWAPKLKGVDLHEVLKANEFIFSEYYKTPWPYYDRQFLLKGTISKKGNKVYFKAQNLVDDSLEDDDHVLASVEILDFVLEEVDGSTMITFTFNGDMGGWIPSFVSRIIRKKWPVRFIQSLEKWSKSGKIRSTIYFENLVKSNVM